jgi:hypothetical protein
VHDTAVLRVADVARGSPSQVAKEGIRVDVSHENLLYRLLDDNPGQTYRQVDEI